MTRQRIWALAGLTAALTLAACENGGTVEPPQMSEVKITLFSSEGVVPPQRIEIRDPRGLAASGTSATDGRVSLFYERRLTPPIELATDPLGSAYYGMRTAGLATLGQEQSFCLAPKVWTLKGGTHDGQQVPIDLLKATDPAGDSAWLSYYGLVLLGGNGALGLPPSLPWPVAFEGFPSIQDLPVAFRQWEAGLGRTLFRMAATVTEAEQSGIVVRYLPNMRLRGGAANLRVNQEGFLLGGTIFLGPDALEVGRVLAHEIGHILGAGHTAFWPSVMSNAAAPQEFHALTPTLEDFAYVQYVHAIHALKIHRGCRYALWEASFALR